MGISADRDLVIAKLQQMQEWLLIAYAVSLPLSMTLSWGLLTAGIIAWAVESGIRHFVKVPHDHGPIISTPFPLSLQIVLLVVAVGLSGALNPGTHNGFSEAVRSVWSLKGLFIYFWASKIFHFHPAVARRAMPWLLSVSAVAGIWGTIQQVFHFHPFTYQFEQGTGFLSNPMAFAGQMQLFATMSLALLLTKGHEQFGKAFENKFLWSAITLANVMGLVFADERSAWIGGLVGIMIVASLVSWKTFLKAAVVVFVASMISFYTIPMVHHRVESTFNMDVGTSSRFKMWKVALECWKQRPFVGVGYMNFPRVEVPEATAHEQNKDLAHAHSNYLQFLATTGTIGEIAYLWLLAGMILVGIKSYVRAKVEKDAAAAGFYGGLLAGMVSLMVAGLFEYNFGTAQVRLAQWFILALLSYEAVKAPHEKGTGPKDTVPDSLPSV